MSTFKTKLSIFIGAVILGMGVSSPVLSDDTEVFFGEGKKSNLFFVLDVSGSMGWSTAQCTNATSPCNADEKNPPEESRLDILKDAFADIMADLPDSASVGVMTFSGNGISVVNEVAPLTPAYRTTLTNNVNALRDGGGTPTAKTMYLAAEYYRGNLRSGGKRLKSPITEGVCQTNNIIFLSDGEPNGYEKKDRNNIRKLTRTKCTGKDDGQECTIDLAGFLSNNDQIATIEDSTVKTHTIAFSLYDQATKDFLDDIKGVAFTGKGVHKTPTNAQELAQAFKDIISEAGVEQGNFVAPSVPLSQSNRLRSGNNLFLGMFQPQAKQAWNGNLKKYFLKNGVITSSDKLTPAVDTATGNFKDAARSFWSFTADGNVVYKGGAATLLNPTNPTIYTNLTKDALDPIDATFTTKYIDESIAAADGKLDKLFGVAAIDKDTSQGYFDWILQRTTVDDDGNLIKRFGDPLHSRPQVLEYDDVAKTSLAFVSTNQGYVHAIDTETGAEKWAFFPRQLMKNIQTWKKDADIGPNDARTYGLDGQMTVYTFKENNVTKHYLYVGMRRGGNYVYVLDITNPSKPSMMFTVGNKFEADLTYQDEKQTIIPNLGQTWSKPVVAKIPDAGASGFSRKLILAGGYDPYYDEIGKPVNPAAGTIAGNAIYQIDFEGSLVSTQFDTINTKMTNSIAADLTLIDIDNDSILENLYAADVGGKIYRVDYDDKNGATSVDVFADVSGDADGSYRFYNKPDIAFANYRGTNMAVLTIGSGYRVNPLNAKTVDKYYAFFDLEIVDPNTTQATLGLSSLLDVTSVDANGAFPTIGDIRSAKDPKEGWFIKLPPGEKVLSSATTLNFVNLFTTFSPASAAQKACTGTLGSNKLYGISLLDGSPAVDSFVIGTVEDNMNDRYTDVSFVGIAPGVTLLFPDDTAIATLVGTQTICTGDDCDFLPDGVKTVKWKQTE